jgi:hypothetical protein
MLARIPETPSGYLRSFATVDDEGDNHETDFDHEATIIRDSPA